MSASLERQYEWKMGRRPTLSFFFHLSGAVHPFQLLWAATPLLLLLPRIA